MAEYAVCAQNLVPNGNFEEVVVCIEYNLNCGPMGWRLTSSDPPSYYSEFKKGDTIASAHWTSFVPFSLFNRGLYREYLQTSILCPLEKGHKYRISMQIKPEEFAIKEFGVIFVSKYILTPENQLIILNPQIKFRADHFWYDPNGNWMTVSAEYIATGTEKYLLIGNFRPNLATEYKEIEFEGKEKKQSTYYVDNVVLKPVNNDPICDYSTYLSVIRNNRWRHTNPADNFFPVKEIENPVAFDTLIPARIIKNKPIILKNIFFDVDKYELLPESNTELKKLVSLLMDNQDLLIEIRGHTDNTGEKYHNEELSLHRAEAVAGYLINNGILQKRITVKGFASESPIDTNETPQGRQKNRRVEFVVN
jgi:outer membrane protein OmpA-like peptidoglycan-associated protein